MSKNDGAVFEYWFNHFLDNLPSGIEKIKIKNNEVNLPKKYLFGCKVVNNYDKKYLYKILMLYKNNIIYPNFAKWTN